MISLFSQSVSHNITTGVLVIGITIGAILAFSVYFFQTRILGSLIRALLKDARGVESAKTLDEIGKNNFFFRFYLRDGSILRKYVSVVGDTVPKNNENEADFSCARFYIDEEKADVAEIRYSRETKAWIFVLGVVAIAVVGAVMYFALPYLLDAIR